MRMDNAFVRPRYDPTARLLGASLLLALTLASLAWAQDPEALSVESIAERAKSAWENGATYPALDILEEGIQYYPQAPALHKLRGDILASSRGSREAVQAYETVLASNPTALDVRWAKWSVLVRSGQGEEAIAELRHLAQFDPQNPLIHLRLAIDLRKSDRLEESLESYKKAVDLAPDLLGWRLAIARARFDVLDYLGADSDVQYVLQRVPPGSPLELPAKNLLALIYGSSSMERGRRFRPVLTPDATPAQLKEWAAIRADAWRLFSAGLYQEAEPIYRRVLALNPRDPTAVHQLGITLMQLGRCKDALTIFRGMSDLDSSDDEYVDTVFRMGQCLVELERWEDAFIHFQTLYEEVLEFEESNRGVQLQAGTRVLNKKKLAQWLEKVRPHVPELADPKRDEPVGSIPSGDPSGSTILPEEDIFAKVAAERLKPQKALDTQTSLMGRDANFSWFRFVIPASKVMRDDFPTGAHEFIPVNPGDSFPMTQREIYLVFGLVSASYDELPLTARCYCEASEVGGEQHPITQDKAVASMNDQSGYFLLHPPNTGWTPGLYRCGLFAGEQTSAYTHVDEVRFRTLQPTPSP